MKKVLIISYYFPPSGGAGVQRWLKMLKYLPEFGVAPIVLTVDEKFASYPQIDNTLLHEVSQNVKVYKTKTCEVLSLYKKVSSTNEIPYSGFANEPHPSVFQKISRFVRGNFFLPDPRRGWNKYAFRAACDIIRKESVDAIITTSPPHSTQLIGGKLKKRFPQLDWIADLRDPWTDIYYNKDLYQTGWAKALNAKYERQTLLHADKIITVSEDCARNFAGKVAKQLPIFVLPNGYDPADFTTVSILPKGEKKVLSYVGVFNEQYRADVLVQALQLLPQESQQKLLLRFVGKVSPVVKQQLSILSCMVEYVDYVPHKEAVGYMCSSDMLLLCVPDIAENKGILTGKLFEYLAAQRPILLLGPEGGDAARILSMCEAGDCCGYDANKLADCIQKYLTAQAPWVATNENYRQYSRKAVAERLAMLLRNC